MPELIYRCKHCKEVYDTEEKAIKCEDSHEVLIVIAVEDYEYESNSIYSKVPKIILCRLSDGSYANYKLMGSDNPCGDTKNDQNNYAAWAEQMASNIIKFGEIIDPDIQNSIREFYKDPDCLINAYIKNMTDKLPERKVRDPFSGILHPDIVKFMDIVRPPTHNFDINELYPIKFPHLPHTRIEDDWCVYYTDEYGHKHLDEDATNAHQGNFS